jgi:bacterioferritin (cytochrome b1)
MNVEEQVTRLNAALALMRRSVLHYSLAAGGLVGFELVAHSATLSDFASAELDDATRLVEKIVALGGTPVNDVAALEWDKDPAKAVDRLVELEEEALQALEDAIEPTGREAASEAVEHRLEHVIMRKQEQVDYILRARRAP